MADFQNILDQLKENNKGSEKASAELREVIVAQTVTRNRSIGASLALQFGRQNKILISVQEALTGVSSTFKDQLEYQKDKDFQAKRDAQGTTVGAGAGGSAAGPSAEGKKKGGLIAGIASALGALGSGIGLGVGGFMAGIGSASAMAGPFVISMTALGGGLAAFIVALGAASWTVSKMMPDIAEGLKSFDDVDGANLVQVGKGIGHLGLGFTAMGAGGAILGVGNLIGSIADGLTGLFGGPEDSKAALIEDIKKFSAVKLDAKQIKENSEAMVAYGVAMSSGAAGSMLSSISTLVSGTIGKLGELFGGVPPMESLIAFSKVTVDKEAVKNNSEAMVEYTKAMAIGAGAKGMEAIGSLANFVTNAVDGIGALLTGGEGVFDSQMSALKTMTKDADEIDPRKVKRVSKAMAWYASSMLTSAPASLLGAVGSLGNLVSNIADGIGSLFGGDSTLDNQLSAMKTMTTESDSIDPEKIKNVAVAMKEYGKAMASGMKASGAGALGDIANFVGGIVKSLGSFFGIAEADPIGDLKKFAKVSITADEVTQIQANATGLEAYATAMAIMSTTTVAPTLGDTIKNVVAGIASFFGVGKDDPLENLKDFAALELDGDAIKADVSSLLGILEDPNVDVPKSENFKTILTNLKSGLISFSNAEFVSGLSGAVTGILSFISGEKSPVAKVIALASSADDLERVGTGLKVAKEGLTDFSTLKGMGDVGLLGFAEQLAESVPLIEAAVAGGEIKKWGPRNDLKFMGLGTGKVNYTLAIDNLRKLNDAFSLRGGAAASQFGEGMKNIALGLDEISKKDLKKLETITEFIDKNAIILGNVSAMKAEGEGAGSSNVNVVGGSTEVNSSQNNMNSISLVKAIAANNDPSAAYAGTSYYG